MAVAISLIPARGGSKTIPKKNILPLAGKPLIAHSIEYSLKCSLIDRTIVSTDNHEIADIALKFGAEILFMRPAEIAKDDTSDFPVLHHALDWLQVNEGFRPDLVAQLRPTTPLRPHDLMERAIQIINQNEQADCVRSVQKTAQTPYKMWKIIKDGSLKPFIQLGDEETFNLPRQKLPKILYHDGLLDVIRTSTIMEKNSVTGNCILPILTEESFLAVDIDKPIDFLLAETIFKFNQKL
jgi:CMP-N,N'-diacetyllegionaminic acid synthase